jgi:UV DNA damage endonuclease
VTEGVKRGRARYGSHMRLGFAVKVLGAGGLPTQDTRRWQSGPHLKVSVGYLHAVFAYLADTEIGMYRMTASLAPYATHPDLPQFHGQVRESLAELAELGEVARAQGLRLSSHPGQYVVLNSVDERIVDAAIRDLELQAELFDAMGLGPEAVVNIHVGGAPDGTRAGIERFEAGFARLSPEAQRRVVVENDDRTYALVDVLDLHERIGRPVVWDILHHHCHDPAGIPNDEALRLALATWPEGVRPKIHYSTPRTDMEERKKKVGRRVERSLVLPQLRAHADLIDPIGFEEFLLRTARDLEFDVMLEAKGKDLALLRLRDQLAARGLHPEQAHTKDGTASATLGDPTEEVAA